MAPYYEVQMNGTKIKFETEVGYHDKFTRCHIKYIFGAQKFESFDELKNFCHRRLGLVSAYQSYWIADKSDTDNGAKVFSAYVYSFGGMINRALDTLNYDMEVCYDIHMMGKPENDPLLGSTYAVEYDSYSDVKLDMKIYIENIRSLKQLCELMVHDVAHGMVYKKRDIFLSNRPKVIGEMNELHGEKWQNAAVMLLDTLCIQPLADELFWTSLAFEGDIRNEIDVTMKVRTLQVEYTFVLFCDFFLNI